MGTNAKIQREGRINRLEKIKLYFLLVKDIIQSDSFFLITTKHLGMTPEGMNTGNKVQSYGLKQTGIIDLLSSTLESVMELEEKKQSKAKLEHHLNDVPQDFLKNLNINNIN